MKKPLITLFSLVLFFVSILPQQQLVFGQSFDCDDCVTNCTCGPGTEYDTVSNNCKSCQPGYFKSSSALVGCESCSAGYFANLTGLSVCYECPAGYKCPNVASNPEPCPAGSFSNTRSTTCHACSDGFYSEAISSICKECSAGNFCNSTHQTPCEKGSYSLSGLSSCIQCELGYYANVTGSVECAICPNGYYCENTLLTPIECPPGKFSAAGNTICNDCAKGYYADSTANSECALCPQGHQCSDPVIEPVICTTGTYSLSGSIECFACASGYYAASNGSASCTICPEGHSCKDARISPVACTPGTFAISGSTQCMTCPNGYFASTEKSSECKICPAGSFCSNPSDNPVVCGRGTYSVIGSLDCIPCSPGYYANETNSTECVPCPSGHECSNDKTTDPVICGVGTYAKQAMASCLRCEIGYYAKDMGSEECVECPAGFKCPNTNSEPVPCAKGNFSIGRATSCSQCSDGYFSINNGSGECEICPSGFACVAGTSIPQPCEEGFFAIEGQSVCTACSSGYYSAQKNSSLCTACPSGYSCSDASASPVECGKGQYSVARSTFCIECDNGYYNNETGQSQCKECPTGYQCLSKTESPSICGPGTVSKARATLCENCVAGHTYMSDSGQEDCLVCPEGYQCDDPTKEPIQGACQNGYYNSTGTCEPCKPGSYGNISESTDCITCPSGYMCPEYATTTPLICVPGTYSTGGLSNCTSCEYGTYQIEEGQETCIDCPQGHSCIDSTAEPMICDPGSYSSIKSIACSLCDAGSYQNVSGQSVCETCPAGYKCTGSGVVDPTICKKGFYSSAGSSSCLNCGSGYYSTQDGSMECKICAEGSWCSSTTETECAIGTYSDVQGLSSCKVCGTGTYSNVSGSTLCTICPGGFSCADAKSNPVPCAKGTYSRDGYTICIACIDGYYTTSTESTTCKICPENHYCADPSSAPIACPDGKISNTGSTKCYATTCGTQYDPATGTVEVCPAGTYYNNSVCNECVAGYKCAGYNNVPVACNDGTYQNSTGQQVCLLCPPGQSCEDPAADPVNCGTGHYSPEGDSYCHTCPMGTFAASTTAASCSQCTPGNYCDGLITACEAGSYTAVYGQSACNQCPTGYHTNGEKGQTGCVACDAGQDCSNQTILPPSCTKGWYSVYGEGNCQECPAGFQCNDPANIKACAVGTYADTVDVRLSCLPCPAGTSCLDPSATPVSCDGGYYSAESEATCTICPAGSSCTESTASPCTDGSYSLVGVGSCTECPENYYCPNTDQLPIQCPSGQTTNGNTGQTECVSCPTGQSCAGGTPISCNATEYIPAGGSTCEPCPAGHSCSGGVATPCASGSYAVAGDGTCTECTAGFACSDQTKAIETECAPGFYSAAGAAYCTVCEAGYECPMTDGSNIKECDPGHYSFGQQIACTPCPAGMKCPNKDGSGNAACNPGQYSVANSESCEDCLAGEACPNTDSSNSIKCEIGTYSTGNQQSCTPCPAGYACPSTTQAPNTTPCEAGTYSVLGNSICKDCDAGFYCPTIYSEVEIQCLPGYYAVAKSTKCTICPAGKECPDSTVEGVDCEDGFYSLAGQTQCTACPAGYQCSNKATEPVICDAGTYSEPQATTCLSCNAGFLCETGSNSATQKPCPIGSYCSEGSVNAVPCPAGKYGKTTGLTAETECSDCPAGYYCESGTGINTLTEANYCPRGYYCPINTASAQDNPCGAGKHNPDLKGESDTACVDCQAGHYCPQGTDYDDRDCAAGYYCPSGTTTQQACPEGTYTLYTGAKSADECYACPPGSYCTSGTSSPKPCPNGTFDNAAGQVSEEACEPCTPGFACTTTGLTQPDEPCDPGHYCPEGTSLSNANPCPEGTYTDYHNTTAESECIDCPSRYYCGSGTGGGTKPDPCVPGFFCSGKNTPTNMDPCPAGSWSNKTHLAMAEECNDCPSGFYCVEQSTTPGVICPDGHYCPQSTGDYQTFPCHSGTYSNKTGNEKYQDCDPCPEGHYCKEGSVNPKACESGTYNSLTNMDSVDACIQCPAGSYCPFNGTTNAIPCAIGTYSNVGNSSCSPCEPGYYCDEPGISEDVMLSTKVCPAGMYCLSGRKTAPNLQNDACPTGSYCLAGNVSAIPIGCPIKTFNSETGRINVTFCTDCTEGYYCDVTNLTLPAGECPPGHYCPTGTGASTSNPCEPGQFLNNSAAISATSCAPCTSGYYCPNEGTYEPTICPAGRYCDFGASIPELCPAGTYSNSTGIKTSSGCTPCTGGYYCDGVGNTEPDAKCSAGYYCVSGATTATPNDTTTGDICIAGGYCPEGSPYPTACPPGTYTTGIGAVSKDNCTLCVAGSYCSGENSVGITGKCAPGYYCTGGASTATQHSTSAGYYSGEGATNQTACTIGTYSPTERASECSPCPAGQYCNDTAMTEGILCPTGAYCNLGSNLPRDCPSGTYNDEEGQSTINDCKICKAGWFCTQPGLSGPEGECLDGYYCKEGSKEQAPETVTSTGGPCPEGYYCVVGSSGGAPCKSGTYLNVTKGRSEADCKPCPAGLTCPNLASTYPTGECAAGYYCTEGADSQTGIPDFTTGSDNWGHECPIGHYCPSASGSPQPCDPGFYQPINLQSVCLDCEEGYQCIGYNNHTECPEGYYCELKTGYDPIPCPKGTFKNITMGADESVCEPCLPGYYCDELGLVLPIKPCSAGYYCRSGVDVATPGTSVTAGDGGICPPGHYCPEGTGEPYMCPEGTYLTAKQQTKLEDCTPCDGGKYCKEKGMTNFTGDCAAGFYCTENSAVEKPTDGIVGNVCPVGHYCPAGTAVPKECLAGTYANVEQQVSCTECQAGYYCPNTTADYTQNECTVGHFCPAGSAAPEPCPPGTYNPVRKLASSEFCTECEPGKFCLGGKETVDGDCAPGYFCISNSSTATPSNYVNITTDLCACPDDTANGICPRGFVCMAGTSTPEPCPPGFYCPTDEMSEATQQCDAGYYCTSMATISKPTDGVTGDVCPEGSYCESGSGSPTPCEVGYFSNQTQRTSPADCKLCTAGYACEKTGLSEPNVICEAGFYCPLGSNSSTQFPCDRGYKCPEGSPAVVQCEAGKYQDEPQKATCKICPAGYYCEFGTDRTDYTAYDCPIGSYCPEGTEFSNQFGCPIGTYGTKTNLETAEECTLCPTGKYCPTEGLASPESNLPDCFAGFFCKNGSKTGNPNDETGEPCPIGKYCLIGTKSPDLCPIGTFNNVTQLSKASDCSECTPGYYCNSMGLFEPTAKCDERYYCPGGDTKPSSPEHNCTIGHYCPKGTPNPYPCEEGFYNTDELQATCLVCPAGSYCIDGINLQDCPAGYYCPPETGLDWSPCRNGTFSKATKLSAAEECMNCTAGNYCDEPAATDVKAPCNAGFYCGSGSMTPTPNGDENSDNRKCRRGYYCPAGTDSELPCENGTYSNQTGRFSQDNCLPCKPGSFCLEGSTEPTGPCAGGYYCTGGAKTDQISPTDSTGGLCPQGYYCPPGTADPKGCEPGTYNNLPGMENCTFCPEGYYCPENTTDYSGNICPAGYYCPLGTKDKNEFPCPPGTFNSENLKAKLQDCQPCSPGKYCEGSGKTTETGKCSEGWYCTTCAWSSQPADPVNSIGINETSCLCPVLDNVTYTGGKCPKGTFCPEGSDEPIPCTSGYYCDTTGLSDVTGECDAGYYCANGSYEKQPTDGVTGDKCPAGFYCPQKTGVPKACPAGKYSPNEYNTDISDCLDCVAGYYCEKGAANLTGPCDPGYYCPVGQSVSTAEECTVGHYCDGNNGYPIPCSNGTYQDKPTQASCKICDEGFYCEANTDCNVVGVVNPEPCIPGYYCPLGTSYSTQYGCKAGTYSNKTQHTKQDDCNECDGGSYCAESGITKPTQLCQAGFYCIQSAITATPRDGTTGDICPAGYFCIRGSATYDPCPSGTYGAIEGLESISNCTQCPPGKYCESSGQSNYTGDCEAGYYCPAGSSSSHAEPCPSGYHCPEGSGNPKPCDNGTYTEAEQQSECITCSAGKICNGTAIENCPMGFYCPEGTGTLPYPCPSGTYGASESLKSEEECTQCDAGYFCNEPPQISTSGECNAGHYCRSGSNQPSPSGGNFGDAGICPSGYYCPRKTGEPIACSQGTFNNETLKTQPEDCLPCLPGHYCEESQLTFPSGECDPGFYCISGSASKNPSATTATGGPCSPGHFCPGGSSLEKDCAGGTYAPSSQLDKCEDCPAGSYCGVGASAPLPCTVGHYCEIKSETPTPCTNGTYNNQTGSKSNDACQLCPPGQYCPNKGMEEPQGNCSAGWYCILGSWMKEPVSVGTSPTPGNCTCPADGGIGGQCGLGEYCPEGSSYPIPCEPGYYCDKVGLSAVVDKCQAGYYCSGGSQLIAPIGQTYGDICPTGHYCEEGSPSPTPCAIGTFSSSTENMQQNHCELCTAGLYCPSPGITDPSPYICSEGFYCISGSNQSNPNSGICPMGAKCPPMSEIYTPCFSGSYQNKTQQGDCLECPVGFYCDYDEAVASGEVGVVTPQICPPGYTCPAGTNSSQQYPCTPGTYNDEEKRGNEECKPCTPGFYCDQSNLTSPVAPCFKGFYCPSGSSSPEEHDCPQGYYCEEQTAAFADTPCPAGKYGSKPNLGSIDDCTECDPGEYCDSTGLQATSGGCTPGYYCELSAILPNPDGESYGDVCPMGAYCPANSSHPSLCPAGTYNPNTKRTSPTDCLSCPSTKYCNDSGLSEPTGTCKDGYYCTGGSDTDSQYICPPGSYCVDGEIIACENGTYTNFSGASVCEICPSRYYCVNRDQADPCTPGHYCPQGTGENLQNCPIGTFNPHFRLASEEECSQCTAGKYCQFAGISTETGTCDDGFFCASGVNTNRPDNITNTGIGGSCMPGYECKNGDWSPCDPGTYADVPQTSDCKICDPGFYCSGGTVTPTICPRGHYCPLGTTFETEYPCVAGTFNANEGQFDSSSCLSCTPGMFCEGDGNIEPTGNCSQGYFCKSNADTATPIAAGQEGITVGNPGNTGNITCNGYSGCACTNIESNIYGICEPGFYCPERSEIPTACDPGYYCPNYGMSEPQGTCDPGHYCEEGSAVADQYACLPGYYCPNGSLVACPPGTFTGQYGNEDESSCEPCTPGYYCDGYNQSTVTGECPAGFYCEGGSTTGTATPCPINHKCPEGSSNATVCDPNTYQPSTQQAECTECLAGMECDPYDGNLEPEACPPGYYCPGGDSGVIPCPAGTFSNQDSLKKLSECTDCTAGFYCEFVASTNITGPCDPGFYCGGKASTKNAQNDDGSGPNALCLAFDGNRICPPGHYCETETVCPSPCPAGTYANVTGKTNRSSCDLCPSGKYCESEGITDGESSPDCSKGYICYGGSTSPRPTDGVTGELCPSGFYCTAGTPAPLPCQPGEYTPTSGFSACDSCPAGTYCEFSNTSVPLSCPKGKFCIINTDIPRDCPIGTYRSTLGATSRDECTTCESGKYCETPGIDGPTGNCSAGYICEGGSIVAEPNAGLDNNTGYYNGPCYAGQYCEEGTGGPTGEPCPVGTFRNDTMGKTVNDCLPCSPGWYCDEQGSTEPTAQCSPGYYCPGTSPNSNPNQYPCDVGYYCPEGSSQQLACPTGQYQPNTAQSSCVQCEQGFYCQESITGNQTDCPPHFYCPAGTQAPIPCPNGTYTEPTQTNLGAPEDCTPCPTGKFCNGGQLLGNCSEGYFCLSGAYSPTTNDPTVVNVDQDPCAPLTTCASQCPPGFYCPEGSLDPIACPENTLRDIPGASQESECMVCPQGKWCHAGDPVPDPCPAGHYCPGLNGSECGGTFPGPQECPLYTYQNETGSITSDDCDPCPAGYWCNETGLTIYTNSACQLGYYCTGGGQAPQLCPAGTLRDVPGAASVDDCSDCTPGYYCPNPTVETPNINGIPCEAGYMCPAGSVNQTECPPGYYCEQKTGEPDVCPAGYSCPPGSSTYTICEYPYYCPEGTGYPLTCPIGYQPLNISGLRDDQDTACMICPAGTYRNSSEDDTCQTCPRGYYCPEGTGNYQQNPCPDGHYCPEGSSSAVQCPTGTYGAKIDGSEYSTCNDCPKHTFNNQLAQSSCKPCGSSSDSEVGSTTCICTGQNRAFQESDGYCVCKSGYTYYNLFNIPDPSGNSDQSCQAVVSPRCTESRRASDGSCVSVDADCSETCGERGGTIDPTFGMCICSETTIPQEIDCFNCLSSMSFLDPSDGSYILQTTNSTTMTTTTVTNVLGPQPTFTQTVNTIFVEFTSTGIFGIGQTSFTTVDDFLDGQLQSDTNSQSQPAVRRRRSIIEHESSNSYFGRRLLQSQNTSDLPIVPNPVLCLQKNEIVLFTIEVNSLNRTLSHYPVYVANHLFNTNPDFDYGDFRQLEQYVTTTNLDINKFAHAFIDSGVYVFADSQNADQELVISVFDDSLVCNEYRINPASELSLTQVGVVEQQPENLEPAWGLIIILLSLFAVLVLVLLLIVCIWRVRGTGIYPMQFWLPEYRSLSHIPAHKMEYQYKATRDRGEAEGAEVVIKDEQLLEDFNVKMLYDKLEDQNLHLSSQLAKHQEDLNGFYERISNQTEGLKKMLNMLDASKLEAMEQIRTEMEQSTNGGPTIVNANVQMEGLQRDIKLSGGSAIREKELLFALHQLIDKLNKGKVPISEEMLNEARERWKKGNKSQTSSALAPIVNSQFGPDGYKAQGQTELIRAQHLEKMDLEKEILSEEKDKLDEFIKLQDEHKSHELKSMSDKLAFKLQGDLTDDELNEILAAHEKDLEEALDKMAAERQRQLKELRKQLAMRRKNKENELNNVHKKQSDDAEIPTDEKDSGENDNLDITQLEMEAANAEQNAEALKESGDGDAQLNCDERGQLSKSIDDQLDALLENGLITEEIREKIKNGKIDRERALQERMNKKKDAQLAMMRKRMTKRRKTKIQELEEKHKKEQEEAGGLTPEMEKRQTAEMAALVAELDAEEAQLELNIKKSTDEEHKNAISDLHRDVLSELGKKYELDPLTQQEILDKYRREAENYEHLLNMKKMQNSQSIKARLAARKARKAAEVLRNAQERAKNRLKEEEVGQLDDLKKHHEELANQEEDDGIFVPEVKPEDNYEQQALEREQENQLVELEQQQNEEVERLKGDLETSERTEEEELEGKLLEDRERMLREKKNKQEAEARARTDLSEEQLQQLMAAHNQELEDLERKANVEQNRQRAALREKLMGRRNRKTNALKKRQELDKQKEILEQKKELQQVAAKTIKDAERKAIIEAIEQNGASASERVIQKVLEKRQKEEMKQLEDEYALKKKMMLEEVLAALNDQYNAMRETTLGKQKQELDELKESGLSEEEYEKAKKEMLEKHVQQLSDLEKEHDSKIKQKKTAVSSACDLELTQAKLKLKERHYQEFADALRDLAPTSGQQLTAEQAEEASRKLEETRERLEKEQQDAEASLSKEWEELEERQKRLIAEEMAAFEKELEEETAKDKLKAEKYMDNQAKKKDKLINEQRKKMQEDVQRAAAAGASEEEQKRIMQQHEKDVEKIINKMDAEKLRMQSQLQDRLKKRRNNKIKNKNEELREKSDQMRSEFEEKQQQQMDEMQAKQAQIMEETTLAMKVASRASTPMGSRPISAASGVRAPVIDQFQTDQLHPDFQQQLLLQQVPTPSYAMAAPMSEEELNALLMASPLYKTMQDIKEILDLGKSQKNTGIGFSGPDLNTTDTELVPTPLSELNARDLIVYKFGTFVIKLLHTHCKFPKVSLLVAEKIPKRAELDNNSFNGSFWFDEGNAILFVRLARLKEDSVGKFILLLLHSVAHIHAGDMTDDQNIEFVAALYSGLAAICDDLFFFRYKGSDAKEVNFASGEQIPTNGFSEDLIDIRIPGANRRGAPPGQQDFLKQAVEDRVEKYSQLAQSSGMRHGLGDKSSASTGSEIGERLKELLPGSKATSKPPKLTQEETEDVLMEEFVHLNREASSIRETLKNTAASSTERVKLENQLNNTEIKISEVQGKLGSTK